MKKLVTLQSRLKAPKGQYNSFGKYAYRSCEDIVEASKPIMAELGLILLLNDEVVEIQDRIYIKATATIIDSETGDRVSVNALAREPKELKGMTEAQITGSASSYARKYALNGLLAIDDTKDSDTEEAQKQANKGQKNAQSGKTADNKKKEESKKEKNNFITSEEKAEIEHLINISGTDETILLGYYKIDSLDEMDREIYISAKKNLQKKMSV